MDFVWYMLFCLGLILFGYCWGVSDCKSKFKYELEEEQEKKIEIAEEYDFYYKLSKSLFETYRPYDIFPSKFARDLNDMRKEHGVY